MCSILEPMLQTMATATLEAAGRSKNSAKSGPGRCQGTPTTVPVANINGQISTLAGLPVHFLYCRH